MNTLRFVTLALLAAAGTAQEAPRWRALFDGATLKGWSKVGGAATYRVEDRAIVGTTAPNTKNTFLRTDEEFGDFDLEFEFRVHPGLNSGVQFRSAVEGVVRGYQFEIDPSQRSWTGGIYEEGRRGWLASLAGDERAHKAFRQGEWNRGRIRCRGPHLRTWVNDVPIANHVDGRTLRGFVALQVHGVGKRKDPLTVRWRRLRIRELGTTSWQPFGEGCWSPVRMPGPGGRCEATGPDGLEVHRGEAPLSLVARTLPDSFVVRCSYRLDGEAWLAGLASRRPLPPNGEHGWDKLVIARAGPRLVADVGDRRILDATITGARARLTLEIAAEAELGLRDLELAVTPAAAGAASRPTAPWDR